MTSVCLSCGHHGSLLQAGAAHAPNRKEGAHEGPAQMPEKVAVRYGTFMQPASARH